MPVRPSDCLLEVRPDVHAGGVEPDEERLVVLDGAFDELRRLRVDFLVDRLHALRGQRAGVLDLLPALAVGPCSAARRAGRTSS